MHDLLVACLLIGVISADQPRRPDFHRGVNHAHIHRRDRGYGSDISAAELAALREMRRVTAPGGRMIVAIWGTPDECEMRVVLKAIRDTMPSPPPGKGPFSLSGPGVLEALIEQTGATVQSQDAADCPFYYDDFDALWRAQRSAGVIQGAIQTVGEAPLRQAVRRAVAPFCSPAGRIRLENRFRFVTAFC